MEAGVRRAERGMTIERRGGMAAVCAGPGRMPEPGAVVDATFLSTGNRSAGRPGKRGREAGGRDNHKLTACSGIRTNRIMVAVPADDRTGDGAAPGPIIGALEGSGSLRSKGPPTCADGAHGWLPDFGAARSAGYRLFAPIKVTDSGRSNGTEGWGEESACQLAGIRGPRAARTWTGSPRKSGRRTARTGRRRSATPRGPDRSACSRRPGERSAGTWRPASGRTSSWRWPARSRSTTQFWRRRGEPDGRVVPAARRVRPAVWGDSCNAVVASLGVVGCLRTPDNACAR